MNIDKDNLTNEELVLLKTEEDNSLVGSTPIQGHQNEINPSIGLRHKMYMRYAQLRSEETIDQDEIPRGSIRI